MGMTPELFIQIALRYVGTPYRYGGNTPDGIDCSGLAEELLSVLGINPPGRQSAQLLYNLLAPTNSAPVQTCGSLAFFGTDKDHITHVGVLISPTHMIEARGGDHLTLTRADAIAKNAFVAVRPIAHRKDLVAIVRPSGLPF